MKFAFVTLTTLVITFTASSASYSVLEPWGETVWHSGGAGLVRWTNTGSEAEKFCEIHLLAGIESNVQLVTDFTAKGNSVPCNNKKADLGPLPDYKSGEYFIRVGPKDGSIETFAYSGHFKYIGRDASHLGADQGTQVKNISNSTSSVTNSTAVNSSIRVDATKVDSSTSPIKINGANASTPTANARPRPFTPNDSTRNTIDSTRNTIHSTRNANNLLGSK